MVGARSTEATLIERARRPAAAAWYLSGRILMLSLPASAGDPAKMATHENVLLPALLPPESDRPHLPWRRT